MRVIPQWPPDDIPPELAALLAAANDAEDASGWLVAADWLRDHGNDDLAAFCDLRGRRGEPGDRIRDWVRHRAADWVVRPRDCRVDTSGERLTFLLAFDRGPETAPEPALRGLRQGWFHTAVVTGHRTMQPDDLPSLEDAADRLSIGGAACGADPAFLARFTRTRRLQITHADSLTDDGLAHVAGMVGLRSLDLGLCPEVSDIGMLHIGRLTGLEGLSVWGGPRVTAWGVACLQRLTALRSLELSDITSADDGLACLGELPELRRVSLADCSGLTAAGVAAVARLPLESLRLAGPALTDDMLAPLPTAAPTLRRLELAQCGSLSRQGVAPLAWLTGLRELSLRWYPALGDGSLYRLAGLTELRELLLTDARRLTDAGIDALTGMTRLERLDLGGCDGLTWSALDRLSGMADLRVLRFSTHAKRAADPLARFAASHPWLEELDLSGCWYLDGDGVRALAGLPRLRRLRVARSSQAAARGVWAAKAALPACDVHIG